MKKITNKLTEKDVNPAQETIARKLNKLTLRRNMGGAVADAMADALVRALDLKGLSKRELAETYKCSGNPGGINTYKLGQRWDFRRLMAKAAA